MNLMKNKFVPNDFSIALNCEQCDSAKNVVVIKF